MNDIQIISDDQFSEVSIVGKHLSIFLKECEWVFDEYDILAIAAEQELETFKDIIKFLDMVVPVENDTYFTLRCEVYQNKIAWKIQNKKAIDNQSIKTYLMTDKETGATKIGRSINPPKRESTLQSEKKEISLLTICDSDIEKELHQRYSHKRIRGEWFNLSQQDITDIIKQYNFKPYVK